jgi:single-strand DNA-binding protein
MANEAQVSLTGYVATQPSFWTTTSGATKVSMRVAWTPRHIDRTTGEWTDGHTSYVTVICWRKLADNVALCIRKGDPVVVKGRLSVRPYEKDGTTRIVVEVDASSIGHDMSKGAAHFQRTKRAPGETAADQLTNGFGASGLPGDDGFRQGDDGFRQGDDTADPGGSGTADGPGSDGAGAGPSESDTGGDGNRPAAGGIFDENAIAALTEEPDSVSAPF